MGLVATPGGKRTSYHLFEANERLCGLLKKSAELHPGVDVRLNYCALSDKPGQSCFAVNESDSGHSFVSESGGVVVDNLVLDDYIAANGITKVNFTKMDIEGSEPLALRGAKKSLSAGIFEVIYIEVSTPTLERMGFSMDDCLKPMTDAGFELFYCKEEDFLSGKAKAEETFYLDLPGGKVKLAPMHVFPSPHHTDLMAIHPASGLLSKRSPK
jgi:FkbM family methyltransferase